MKNDYLSDISSKALLRENAKNYIPLSSADEAEMLAYVGANSLDDLFLNLEKSSRFENAPDIGEAKTAAETIEFIERIAQKNRAAKISFLPDDWKVPALLSQISNIRGLTTAYTPYQPERSQGTLITHWIYQCSMAALTGFEAVNCSLYDGASAIFEAISAACRLSKKYTVLLCETLPQADIDVVKTLAKETAITILYAPLNKGTGLTDTNALEKILNENSEICALAFSQANTFGLLEDVDALANICDRFGVKKIAVADPALLAPNALKEPSAWGENGADILVGEAKHLCSPPNFGGPTLGLFAVRFNDKVKNDIRQAPGRFVGKAKDLAGRDCFAMVLSTREQHIRREKATSNICSNQAFMATLAGASLIAKGSDGLESAANKAKILAKIAFEKLLSFEKFAYPFADSAFFNSFTLEFTGDANELIESAAQKGLHIGVEIENKNFAGRNFIKFSFSDKNSESEIDELAAFLKNFSAQKNEKIKAPEIAKNLLRTSEVKIPNFSEDAILAYYKKLGENNISPDLACYPLGSCTMKYNPYLNDSLAGLDGFANAHPNAPISSVQGSLEILWQFAEKIKKITGLDAVACQPVAGAQGELCALKMIQAYQNDNSKTKRDIILIPESAHGTNFASAAVAGFADENIIHLAADANGQLSMADLKEKLALHSDRVCAIMITNPNTSGLIEAKFAEIAKLVHDAGGLVFMDGANYNAVASQLNLKAIGVDAIHNNLHKTWSISHGGGGPGDAFVAIDEKLKDYIPSYVVENKNGIFSILKPAKSIGSVHANFGNFAHKIRALSYILKLGASGVRAMSANAVLSARYLFKNLRTKWESLPKNCENEARMHEFILTISDDDFKSLESAGVEHNQAIARIGKLFLDYGFHAPTVAFPEVYGLMVEPTESYTKTELDRFAEAVLSIKKLIKENPQAVARSPRFTPIDRVDEPSANRKPILSEILAEFPKIHPNRISPEEFAEMNIPEIENKIKNFK